MGLPPTRPESRLRGTLAAAWGSPRNLGAERERVGGEAASQVDSLLAKPNNDPVALTQRRTGPCTSQRPSLLASIEGPPRRKLARKPILWGAAQLQPRPGGSGERVSAGQAGHSSPAPEAPVTSSRVSLPAAFPAVDTFTTSVFHLFPNPATGPRARVTGAVFRKREGVLGSRGPSNAELDF